MQYTCDTWALSKLENFLQNIENTKINLKFSANSHKYIFLIEVNFRDVYIVKVENQ